MDEELETSTGGKPAGNPEEPEGVLPADDAAPAIQTVRIAEEEVIEYEQSFEEFQEEEYRRTLDERSETIGTGAGRKSLAPNLNVRFYGG